MKFFTTSCCKKNIPLGFSTRVSNAEYEGEGKSFKILMKVSQNINDDCSK